MKLLAVDTSSDACSAALYADGRYECVCELAPRGHADLILVMVSCVLERSGLTLRELDALAFGRGPGSFTGLRIAAGVTQGLALGAGLPVVPVSSLQALAQGARRRSDAGRVLCAVDARMGEVYWGAFECADDGVMSPCGAETVCAPERVPVPVEGCRWHAAGSAWLRYAEQMSTRLGVEIVAFDGEALPDARDVALLGCHHLQQGGSVAADAAYPSYLRDRVATPSSKARS